MEPIINPLTGGLVWKNHDKKDEELEKIRK
jgi:hypothetical protein